MARGAHAAALLFASRAAGHATMVQPMPRNSGGSKSAPSFPGAGANFPGCAGDACLWYSVGCYIGCKACSSTGKDMYGTPATNGEDGHGGPCTKPMEPTNNNATQRTNNPNNKSPHGDWTKYMPWRAPGFAPNVNPCGVASAFKPSSPNAPEIPAGHKQYENGTTLPRNPGSNVVWKAGQAAEVAWAISANHGGGYQYRVCPKSYADVTEACFQAHPLAFTESTTTIHYTDGSKKDVVIPAVTFSDGTSPAGSAWRKNPIPMCNCDLGGECRAPNAPRTLDDTLAAAAAAKHVDALTCTADAKCANTAGGSKGLVGCKKCADPASGAPAWSCAQCCDACKPVSKSGGTYCDCGGGKPGQDSDMFTAYGVDPDAAAQTPECPTGLQYPRLWADGYGDGGNCLYPQGPNSPKCSPFLWTMNDKVLAPTAPGDYTLQFRWDCEHTPQVWNQCADVTVEA